MISLRNVTLRRGARVLLDAVGVTINPGNVVSTGFTAGPMPAGILSNNVAVGSHAAGTLLYVTDQSSGLFTNAFTLEPRRYGIAAGFRF